MKTGVELIAEERKRQIEVEGWTAEHDAEHINGELAKAAICYADPNVYYHQRNRVIRVRIPNEFWPKEWDIKWFKPTDRIKDLVKAGALIAAEIDRLSKGEIVMDYEKNKEAMAIVKQMVADGQIAQDVAEKYFPELAESEDEKIRKSLIGYFGRFDARDEFDENIEFGKVVAWLEKQCEQKEWSKEDKLMRGKTINFIEQAKMYVDAERMPNRWADDCINWLKSLKDRYLPQPKQEWCEEDENMISNLQSELSNLAARKLIKESTYQKYSDWLKTIRPKKQWKPTEEQISALKSALDPYPTLRPREFHNLKELLEQLKAL